MKSNYKELGKYIKQVGEKNSGLVVKNLQGISINKEFMPSVANVIGTDMSNYRVVRKGMFAYNPMHVGRDEVLPIRLLEDDEPVLVSPAYTVFQIIDTEQLLPEYLMMWFRRSEFDRRAWFTTDSSVRGGFSWESLCEMKLPVPHITKQREVVKEYNVLIEHISINKEFNQKIEEIIQSIYEHWFIDFDFPDDNGDPYNSSGSQMIESEIGKIPVGWNMDRIINNITIVDNRGKTPPNINNKTDFPLIEIAALKDVGRVVNFEKIDKYVDQKNYLSWFSDSLRGEKLCANRLDKKHTY